MEPNLTFRAFFRPQALELPPRRRALDGPGCVSNCSSSASPLRTNAATTALPGPARGTAHDARMPYANPCGARFWRPGRRRSVIGIVCCEHLGGPDLGGGFRRPAGILGKVEARGPDEAWDFVVAASSTTSAQNSHTGADMPRPPQAKRSPFASWQTSRAMLRPGLLEDSSAPPDPKSSPMAQA